MAKVAPKDLFDEKTMTFGEHLEELRFCLWRALIGVGIGLVIGLVIGKRVMTMVRYPIDAALEKHGIQVVENPSTKDDKQQGSASESPAQPEPLRFDVRPVFEKLKETDPERFADLKIPSEPIFVPLTPDRPVAFQSPEEVDKQIRAKADSQFYGVYEPTVQGAFMAYLKVSLVTGIVLSSPWVFYQVWMFVAAGLYHHERHYVYVYLPFSLSLFLGGVLFCFLYVLPMVLDFLLTFNRWMDIAPMIRLTDWISFAIMLPLMFGVAFQMPLVMLFLERIGLFTVEDYKSKRRAAILVIAFASMMLTPSDPGSMIAMMIPLLFLYEGGIFLVKFMRRRSPFEEEQWQT